MVESVHPPQGEQRPVEDPGGDGGDDHTASDDEGSAGYKRGPSALLRADGEDI